MENNRETFEYTYSAEEQEEIEKIRSKYEAREDDKLEQLRKLDRSVTKPGTVVGLILGIVGCLTFGGGVSCTLEGGDALLIPGIILGTIGIVLMIVAYPVFKMLTEKEKKRIGPLILALTEELEK